ncbi:DUF2752 domain-containing protein [Aeromicrobium sp. IC_218]|uniref:DUF2752 domain-containing protein n=1 Tax=Aeromicrobium sp. IC_218 TaxID=2545468 RepID=UPI00103D8B2D|nr:DUF2752 domain-containing protein [Aeromicrobium sp. IC_218]TCI99791.1 DUF2752 domain-containing protein [Aeromicrobium sp. IC_218]
MSTVSTRDARWSALRGPAGVAVGGLALGVLLHVRDPHDSGSYGYCPFLLLGDRPCPGCGGLRAANLLTNGDVVGAISSNLLAVVLVGVLAVAWVVWVVRRWRGEHGARMIVLSGRAGAVLIAAVVAFGIVRNLPFGAWLAP